ncbi:MAG TPA: fumarylacetoacetate hydrolase family protein [Steroidobacteraceae bacterium]
MADEPTAAAAVRQAVAERFVAARLSARALPDYPGPLPGTLADAYARQDAAISLWPDEIAGWKVGGIVDAWAARVGESRLVGPIFRRRLWPASDRGVIVLPVIPGGFAAVEAEYVLVLGESAPPDRTEWTPGQAAQLVAELRVGIELAGSPLATINDLGPAVVVSDFGNNAGLVLGEPLDDWRSRPMESLTCETQVNGRRVGQGSAASTAGGPLGSLAFALACCARRGRPLQAGDVISTGACTGIHPVRIGEEALVTFAGAPALRCRVSGATPENEARAP